MASRISGSVAWFSFLMISLVYEARPSLDLTENRHSVTHRYRGLKIIKMVDFFDWSQGNVGIGKSCVLGLGPVMIG